MTRNEMVALIQKGHTPLEVSVQKWHEILFEGGENVGRFDCALCYVWGDNMCEGCPLKSCGQNSVYGAWSNHHEEEHNASPAYIVKDCITCVKLAKNIYDKLCQILEKEKNVLIGKGVL